MNGAAKSARIEPSGARTIAREARNTASSGSWVTSTAVRGRLSNNFANEVIIEYLSLTSKPLNGSSSSMSAYGKRHARKRLSLRAIPPLRVLG